MSTLTIQVIIIAMVGLAIGLFGGSLMGYAQGLREGRKEGRREWFAAGMEYARNYPSVRDKETRTK